MRQRLKFLTTALLGAAVSFSAVAPLRGQAPPPSNAGPDKTGVAGPGANATLPKFEVATVKPTKADEGQTMMMFTSEGISIHGVPMKMLVRESFGIEDDRDAAHGARRTTRAEA